MIEDKLPEQIEAEIKTAESIQSRLDAYNTMHPRVGRPSKPVLKYDKVPCLVAESVSALDALISQAETVLGPRVRGNKRHAYKALYADLTQHFTALKSAGVPLPRKHLNIECCSDHLAEILHRYGYLSEDELNTGAIYKEETRRYLVNTLGRIFCRITDTLTPCNNP